MSDVKDLSNNQAKTPLDSAVNKIREVATKEIQKNIEDTVKSLFEARKVVKTLESKLKSLGKEYEVEKTEGKELEHRAMLGFKIDLH